MHFFNPSLIVECESTLMQIRYIKVPALSAQGDAVQHPGPLDVDGGDGPDHGHPRHRPHQPVHLRVDK